MAEITQPLRLQGQYFDPEIDLCYNRHRYFDPTICSFISQDPLGLAAGENVYAYAPNVWGWVDPLGLSCKALKNPLKGINRSEFKALFDIKGKRRLRSMWDQYRYAPEKFFGRTDIQDTLKADGRIPYSTEEKAQKALIQVDQLLEYTKGDSGRAKAIQAGTNFLTGFIKGMPDIYDTPWGKVGTVLNHIVSKLLPL